MIVRNVFIQQRQNVVKHSCRHSTWTMDKITNNSTYLSYTCVLWMHQKKLNEFQRVLLLKLQNDKQCQTIELWKPPPSLFVCNRMNEWLTEWVRKAFRFSLTILWIITSFSDFESSLEIGTWKRHTGKPSHSWGSISGGNCPETAVTHREPDLSLSQRILYWAKLMSCQICIREDYGYLIPLKVY